MHLAAGAACARATRSRARSRSTATGRGFHANIAAGLDEGFRDSACVSCGACADTCPTDAITEVSLLTPGESSHAFDATVTTTCGYCGVGCRLEAHARDGKIASISPALDGPANEGHTCLKGRFAHQFSRHRDRLTTPLIREGGDFRLATWEEAIHRITTELTRIKTAARPGRDRRPRLLARDERGLLRDAAPDARRDRHQQHRQLLARLPLADLVRAAQVARPLRRDRLLRATSTTPTRRS